MSEQRLVALIRGINVGKNNRLAMQDLRGLIEAAGGAAVTTLLQSGNAVFAGSGSAVDWQHRLSQALAGHGLKVPVIVRTAAALAKAVEADPFGSVATDPRLHLLGFFSATPSASARSALDKAVEQRKVKGGRDSGDEYKIVGDHVYLWCPINVHESIFATVNWDAKLGVDVTMRNFATVEKLLAIS